MRDLVAYVALGRDGQPRPWTIQHRRLDCIERATETMMSAMDYHRLSNRSDRWNYCYRRGCRIVMVRLVPERGEEG